ncbi:PadR family transcriptional regulator [Pseudomonas amygdali pv. tabaci str. ATCC 11528]|uniref:Transcriptional regulator, PadR family n=16 Tax=Pseudomonas TaxID=286 RepID=A0AAX1VZK2_PSEAJ|nr:MULTISPECIES: PadR family transcriptional regulator [Pseudomonas]EGH22190.1 PadR family transcriptional regulator [Pseudomonas amygdali pv. mori str. 301020]KPB82199.1 Transcriptional regulator [Pseudomonas syringae pv. maculicola]AAZ37770.1 transcriptional regulator, PadR family [Pseudomonas savastanoi pv. phaseolicola 1448A]ARA79703.1 PadR family transcriptional regulator [Pseudomonas amygdali pv. lachrymans]AXH54960.1 PadR family transcriptional regulator [Pseudomonas amygdali pv. lachry
MREDKHPPHHRPPHLREPGEDRDGFEKRPGRERGGRGPRVFAPGDLKLLLLALIAEQPAHGYDLIRKIEGLFEGAYCPSPGVIYPTLTFLEESEMVVGDAQAGKKLYTITDAGRQSLEDQAVALEGVRMRIDVSKRSLRGHDRPPEIHEAVHNLRHALQMHHGRWTPEEILRVSELLNSTAKAVVDGPQPTSEESA